MEIERFTDSLIILIIILKEIEEINAIEELEIIRTKELTKKKS